MSKARKGRLAIAAAVAAVVASALVFVPAAMESNTGNGLFAYVVPTTRGPWRRAPTRPLVPRQAPSGISYPSRTETACRT